MGEGRALQPSLLPGGRHLSHHSERKVSPACSEPAVTLPTIASVLGSRTPPCYSANAQQCILRLP